MFRTDSSGLLTSESEIHVHFAKNHQESEAPQRTTATALASVRSDVTHLMSPSVITLMAAREAGSARIPAVGGWNSSMRFKSFQVGRVFFRNSGFRGRCIGWTGMRLELPRIRRRVIRRRWYIFRL